MTRTHKRLILGLALFTAGLFLFIRFWVIVGTEVPADQNGMLSNLDWGTFFVSPVLILAGVSLSVWALVSERRRRRPVSAWAEFPESMRVLESTH